MNAIRLPGEEVFIDYGPEWERAWDEHVKNWVPPRRVEHWVTAKEANDNMEEILSEFISGDLRETVNHPYLFTACQYYASEADKDEVYQEEYVEWTDFSDEDILRYYSEKADGYEYWDKKQGYSRHDDYSHWPCSVIYEEQVGTYTVRIEQSPYEEEMPWAINDLPRILTSYSRKNIHYFVKPFASDQFLPGVFRHPLAIPDDMFPEQWKNLA